MCWCRLDPLSVKKERCKFARSCRNDGSDQSHDNEALQRATWCASTCVVYKGPLHSHRGRPNFGSYWVWVCLASFGKTEEKLKLWSVSSPFGVEEEKPAVQHETILTICLFFLPVFFFFLVCCRLFDALTRKKGHSFVWWEAIRRSNEPSAQAKSSQVKKPPPPGPEH